MRLLFVLFVTILLTHSCYRWVKLSASRYKVLEKGTNLLRVRKSAASLCYGFAWLSMVALIAMISIAELLMGESGVSSPSLDAETRAHLSIGRRISR
jgi:hypothetical protein